MTYAVRYGSVLAHHHPGSDRAGESEMKAETIRALHARKKKGRPCRGERAMAAMDSYAKARMAALDSEWADIESRFRLTAQLPK